MTRAEAAYQAKDFARCAAIYDRQAQAIPASAVVAYNGACCHALAGHADDAFRDLALAFRRGFRDPALLEEDADLASLRTDARWPQAVAAAREADARYRATHHAELHQMFVDDQADRRREPIDWKVVGPRDERRLARTIELVEAGAPRTADDYYHAAMILQHGDKPRHYRLAHELARKAVELEPKHALARWLACAAEDRYLQSMDQPQVWGTQFRKVGAFWTMEPIDDSARTDAERAEWNVPPIAEARARLDAMNRQ